MNITTKHLAPAALAALAVALLCDPAFAAGGEGWEKPATDIMTVLQSGLVKIGSLLIGIGIIVFGGWGALTGRIEWNKFGFILIGGILVMAGPSMIKLLLAAATAVTP